MRKFLYKLFFTRNDDLDVLQILFTGIILHTLYICWVLVKFQHSDAVIIEALITLRYLAGILAITAVPKWMVPFISKKETPVD